MVTVGEIHKEYFVDKDGNNSLRDFIELGMTIDERISDGLFCTINQTIEVSYK